jgi:hypothetical protein
MLSGQKMSRAARGLVTTEPRTKGLNVWGCLHAVVKGDLQELATGSSDGLSRTYQALRYLQCDDKYLDMVALAVPEDVAVDEELQDRAEPIRQKVRLLRHYLRRFRETGLPLLERRVYRLAAALDVDLTPLQILDAMAGRALPAQLTVAAFLVTMLAAYLDEDAEAALTLVSGALERARAAFPRLQVHTWIHGAAWVAGWADNRDLLQWADDRAAAELRGRHHEGDGLGSSIYGEAVCGAAAAGHRDQFQTLLADMKHEDGDVFDEYCAHWVRACQVSSTPYEATFAKFVRHGL